MSQNRRRFLLALGGVGAALCWLGLIVAILHNDVKPLNVVGAVLTTAMVLIAIAATDS